MQCHFWNAGRGSIRLDNVLQPVKLVLGDGAEVLDTAVVRQSRPSVVDFKFSLDRTPEGRRTNKATATFKILEQGDGATLQVVYIGGPKTPVTFEGAIEGTRIQRLIRPLEESEAGVITWDKRRRTFEIVIFVYALLPIIYATFRNWEKIWGRGGGGFLEVFKRRTYWVQVIVVLVAAGGLYYYLFFSYPDIPLQLLH